MEHAEKINLVVQQIETNITNFEYSLSQTHKTTWEGRKLTILQRFSEAIHRIIDLFRGGQHSLSRLKTEINTLHLALERFSEEAPLTEEEMEADHQIREHIDTVLTRLLTAVNTVATERSIPANTKDKPETELIATIRQDIAANQEQIQLDLEFLEPFDKEKSLDGEPSDVEGADEEDIGPIIVDDDVLIIPEEPTRAEPEIAPTFASATGDEPPTQPEEEPVLNLAALPPPETLEVDLPVHEAPPTPPPETPPALSTLPLPSLVVEELAADVSIQPTATAPIVEEPKEESLPDPERLTVWLNDTEKAVRGDHQLRWPSNTVRRQVLKQLHQWQIDLEHAEQHNVELVSQINGKFRQMLGPLTSEQQRFIIQRMHIAGMQEQFEADPSQLSAILEQLAKPFDPLHLDPRLSTLMEQTLRDRLRKDIQLWQKTLNGPNASKAVPDILEALQGSLSGAFYFAPDKFEAFLQLVGPAAPLVWVLGPVPLPAKGPEISPVEESPPPAQTPSSPRAPVSPLASATSLLQKYEQKAGRALERTRQKALEFLGGMPIGVDVESVAKTLQTQDRKELLRTVHAISTSYTMYVNGRNRDVLKTLGSYANTLETLDEQIDKTSGEIQELQKLDDLLKQEQAQAEAARLKAEKAAKKAEAKKAKAAAEAQITPQQRAQQRVDTAKAALLSQYQLLENRISGVTRPNAKPTDIYLKQSLGKDFDTLQRLAKELRTLPTEKISEQIRSLLDLIKTGFSKRDSYLSRSALGVPADVGKMMHRVAAAAYELDAATDNAQFVDFTPSLEMSARHRVEMGISEHQGWMEKVLSTQAPNITPPIQSAIAKAIARWDLEIKQLYEIPQAEIGPRLRKLEYVRAAQDALLRSLKGVDSRAWVKQFEAQWNTPTELEAIPSSDVLDGLETLAPDVVTTDTEDAQFKASTTTIEGAVAQLRPLTDQLRGQIPANAWRRVDATVRGWAKALEGGGESLYDVSLADLPKAEARVKGTLEWLQQAKALVDASKAAPEDLAKYVAVDDHAKKLRRKSKRL